MTISTESSQVCWIIIKTITVYVVYVQLADVYWLEVTFLAVLFAVSVVGRTRLHLVDLIDSLATVST